MANQPVRSISLPSREHPCSVRIEALLNHLKSYQPSSVSSTVHFSFETIQTSLIALAELYASVEEFLNSPSSQQVLLLNRCGSPIEEALDSSITLLDTCNLGRDILLSMKEHVQTLQSSLRRKGGDSTIEANIHSYICFRKKAKKDISKCLGKLKKMESNIASSPPTIDLNQDLSIVIRILRETRTATISIFRFLLKFLSMYEASTNFGRWSLVSKLMRMRLSSPEKEQKMVNLVGNVDVALLSLLGNLQSNEAAIVEKQMTQKLLETLNWSSESLAGGLDCMFRCLVQNRVSLLNIITC
ncbi:hypothetical protein UlMin_039665 [Ulmus minor]